MNLVYVSGLDAREYTSALQSALQTGGQIVSIYEDLDRNYVMLVEIIRRNAEAYPNNSIIIIFKTTDTTNASSVHGRVTQLCGTWLQRYNCPVATRSSITRDQLNAIGYNITWVY